MKVKYLSETVGNSKYKSGEVEDVELWVDENHPYVDDIFTVYTGKGMEDRLSSSHYKMVKWSNEELIAAAAKASRTQLVTGFFVPHYIAFV